MKPGWPLSIALLATATVCSACPGTSQAADQEPETVSAGHFTTRLLDLRVNTVCKEKAARLLQNERGELFASRETLAAWGLAVPPVSPISHQSRDYYPISALPDVEAHIDEARQELVLVAGGAGCFQPFALDLGAGDEALPQRSAAGGFINYDVLHQGGDGGSASSATLELGLHNRLGTGTATMLMREVAGRTNAVRLNTTWRHDRPGRMRTLTLGDAFSRSASWGRSVQFGGVQWGKNFDVRPGFISHPLPRISGEATVPATVELYTNNMRRLQDRLPPGPFIFREIPAVTGMNDVRLVVEDVLGREQVISQSFYVSRSLLKRGLHDYTYEAGAVRRNFARRSNDYGRSFAAATHRMGLTDVLTGELRAELLEEHRTVGITAAWLPIPALGVVNGAAAYSSGEDGQGVLFSTGVERKGRRWSYGIRATWADADFRQLGLNKNQPAPTRVVTASAGGRLAGNLSLSLTYSELAQRDGTDNRFANVSLSTRLGPRLFLRGSLLRDLDTREDIVSLSVALPLGRRTSATVNHRREDSGHSSRLQLQRNPPRGTGFGYRLSTEANRQDRNRYQAQLQARTEVGSYQVEAVRRGADSGYRLNAQGGLAFIAGQVFASRTIDESFAVVTVGQYPRVRVYHENHLIDRTNEHGAAFIPDLRAFEENHIRIAADDLPLGAQIDQLETIAVPGHRQGALVRFDAAPVRGALITILDEDEQPLPAGALVRRAGTDEYFPVARHGQAWVTGLDRVQILEAEWGQRRCTFELRLPEEPGPVPRLGPVICREFP